MFRKSIYLFFALLISSSISFASSDLCYVEFNTSNMDQLESEIVRFESSGAEVVHIFPPDAVFARIANGEKANIGSNSAIRFFAPPEKSNMLKGLASGSEYTDLRAFSIWQYLIAADAHGSDLIPDSVEPLHNCVIDFGELDTMDVRFPQKPNDEMFTSNYLIGRVALKMILMESSGDEENWNSSQEDLAIAEMIAGTDFLSQKVAEHGTNLSWVYDISINVPTGFEPIMGRSVPYLINNPLPNYKFEWMDDALDYLGYARDEWDGVFEMANDMRKTYHADWGFSAFVVMDDNDFDHKFSDGYFAYVKRYNCPGFTEPWNACFTVMTYNNDGYGPYHMDKVFRHEVGHIFRAPDEYYQPGYGGCEEDDCTTPYGYLQVDNANCERCNPDPVDCIMYYPYSNSYCEHTIGHLGWRESDGDGPPDAIDPNNGGWMSIVDVNPGDLIKIFTLDGDFVNLISVTSDNLLSTDTSSCVIWNGHNYDNQAAVQAEYYIVSINDGDEFVRDLHIGNPSAYVPYFSDISYSSGKLTWKLNQSDAYIRCFIYDQSNELVTRLIWDKAYYPNTVSTNSLDLIPSGQNYAAKFYAWRSDGAGSDIIEYQFYHGCRGMCGDVDNNGLVNVSDAVYVYNYVFAGGGLPLPVLACGDANSDGTVNVSDAVRIINYIFAGGDAPGDCSPGSPNWIDGDCCPFEE